VSLSDQIMTSQPYHDGWHEGGVRHLSNEHEGLAREIGVGFIGVARENAAQDRNNDAHTRWLGEGQCRTDATVGAHARWIQGSIDDVGRDVNANGRYLDGNIDGGRRETERGFWRTNEHIADAERRIERDVDAARREGVAGHLRTDDVVINASRRVEGVAYHGFERNQDHLSGLDRRVEVRLEGLAGETAIQAERTRCVAEKGELETRLYLRDREDRTEDLIRLSAERTQGELYAFERRARDEDERTRELLRHHEALRAERELIRSSAIETQLRTKIDVLEAELRCGEPRRREVRAEYFVERPEVRFVEARCADPRFVEPRCEPRERCEPRREPERLRQDVNITIDDLNQDRTRDRHDRDRHDRHERDDD
jgi:hypothetical protein